MIDIVFDACIADVLDDYISDLRLKDALFGQGVIAAYGGPKDPGTASIKLMHYQGDLEGQGPVWGYVKGGMGMISFAIADAAEEAGATLATGVPVAEITPGRGRHARGRDLHPRPHGALQRGPEAGADDAARRPGRLPGAAGGLEDPQPGREVQCGAHGAPRVDRGAEPGRGPREPRSTSRRASTPRSAPSSSAPRASPPSGSARSTSRPATTPARHRGTATC